MDMTLATCRDFVSALASDSPAPGGGGAAFYYNAYAQGQRDGRSAMDRRSLQQG